MQVPESGGRPRNDVGIGLVVVPLLDPCVLLGSVDHVSLIHGSLANLWVHLGQELDPQRVEVDDVHPPHHESLVHVEKEAVQAFRELFTKGWGFNPHSFDLREIIKDAFHSSSEEHVPPIDDAGRRSTEASLGNDPSLSSNVAVVDTPA